MTGAKDKDDWIDALLDDVAQMPVDAAPTQMMSRILADAQAVQPAPGGLRAVAWWRRALADIGGWASVGGLVAATVTGLAIGLGAFSGVGFDPAVSGWDTSAYATDALSANGWDLEDG